MANVIEDFYIFEDIETTGLRKGHDEVVEIASQLVTLDFKPVAQFDQKIQFDHSKMTKEAQEKNGYDPKIWSYEAIPFFEYQVWLDKFVPYPHIAIPVGHGVDFDYGILEERYYKPTGKFFRWSYSKICTITLARAMRAAGVFKSADCKLETVCDALKIHVDGPQHRAWPDMIRARRIFEFHQELMRTL